MWRRYVKGGVAETNLLSHRGQESLRIEEARHHETDRSSFEHPRVELGVSVNQIGEPESECQRLPGDL